MNGHTLEVPRMGITAELPPLELFNFVGSWVRRESARTEPATRERPPLLPGDQLGIGDLHLTVAAVNTAMLYTEASLSGGSLDISPPVFGRERPVAIVYPRDNPTQRHYLILGKWKPDNKAKLQAALQMVPVNAETMKLLHPDPVPLTQALIKPKPKGYVYFDNAWLKDKPVQPLTDMVIQRKQPLTQSAVLPVAALRAVARESQRMFDAVHGSALIGTAAANLFKFSGGSEAVTIALLAGSGGASLHVLVLGALGLSLRRVVQAYQKDPALTPLTTLRFPHSL